MKKLFLILMVMSGLKSDAFAQNWFSMCSCGFKRSIFSYLIGSDSHSYLIDDRILNEKLKNGFVLEFSSEFECNLNKDLKCREVCIDATGFRTSESITKVLFQAGNCIGGERNKIPSDQKVISFLPKPKTDDVQYKTPNINGVRLVEIFELIKNSKVTWAIVAAAAVLGTLGLIKVVEVGAGPLALEPASVAVAMAALMVIAKNAGLDVKKFENGKAPKISTHFEKKQMGDHVKGSIKVNGQTIEFSTQGETGKAVNLQTHELCSIDSRDESQMVECSAE